MIGKQIDGFLASLEIRPDRPEVASELAAYYEGSFGNPTRIDYGTGHEFCFVGFLVALSKITPFTGDDYCSIGLRVFGRYLLIVQTLQKVYSLEPAGSHGVWGLDDYQFVPFIWGSSQLI